MSNSIMTGEWLNVASVEEVIRKGLCSLAGAGMGVHSKKKLSMAQESTTRIGEGKWKVEPTGNHQTFPHQVYN